MDESRKKMGSAIKVANQISSLSRRGFLYSAAGAVGAVAVSGSLWPQPNSPSEKGEAGLDSGSAKGIIPPPSPAHTNHLIGAMYFGGWELYDNKDPWDPVRPYPDRRPILGFYDGGSPEVADWDIKWALESGIQFFVYCWYRKKENLGHPVTVDDLFLHRCIHQGLFHAKYQDQFRFAIMWENENAGGVSSESDLIDNLLPFWIENYFRRANYLKINSTPVLYVYRPEHLIKGFGGVARTKSALDHIREVMRSKGFPGLFIFGEHRGTDSSIMTSDRASGFDAMFAYCIGPENGGSITSAGTPRPSSAQYPSPEETIAWQMDIMQVWKQKNEIPIMPTASVGWDPMPWHGDDSGPDYLNPKKMVRWRLAPEQYQSLLQRIKEFMPTLPADNPGRNMLLLDNWNEWAEGHFLSPHAGAGFGYLRAVREVFCSHDNRPDYRSPFELGLGPYDLHR